MHTVIAAFIEVWPLDFFVDGVEILW